MGIAHSGKLFPTMKYDHVKDGRREGVIALVVATVSMGFLFSGLYFFLRIGFDSKVFFEITGVRLNSSLEYPGVSLLPTWNGKSLSRDPMIWRWWSKAAVLDGSIKLIDFWPGPQQKQGNTGFYDLATNPGEIPEQALVNEQLEKQMRKILSDWRERYENRIKSCPQDQNP